MRCLVSDTWTYGFQFTHPVWGATASSSSKTERNCLFQFTHPVWGATYRGVASVSLRRFNSRTPCGVRHRGGYNSQRREEVSIHAPRVGCDRLIAILVTEEIPFQFTHPVWGATSWFYHKMDGIDGFQFTHPVWGATAISKGTHK